MLCLKLVCIHIVFSGKYWFTLFLEKVLSSILQLYYSYSGCVKIVQVYCVFCFLKIAARFCDSSPDNAAALNDWHKSRPTLQAAQPGFGQIRYVTKIDHTIVVNIAGRVCSEEWIRLILPNIPDLNKTPPC